MGETPWKIPKFSMNSLDLDGEGEAFPVDKEVLQKRRAVLDSVNMCLGNQNAKSTILTYESIIKQEVIPAEKELDTG